MNSIQVLDKTFIPYLDKDTIQQKVEELAKKIDQEFAGKDPLFLAILNGSFMFASELFKYITIPAQISFIKLASYEGIKSTGRVITMIGLDERIKDKNIILLEDIIDSGRTLHEFMPQVLSMGVQSLSLAALFVKPDALMFDIKPDFKGFDIENKFVVGYGMDYNGYGRNLPALYQLNEE